jgi:hypothetical protein
MNVGSRGRRSRFTFVITLALRKVPFSSAYGERVRDDTWRIQACHFEAGAPTDAVHYPVSSGRCDPEERSRGA